jgi:hypothetical protein
VARNLEDRAEKELVECVLGRSYDVGPGGVYYVGCPDHERGLPLYRLDAGTGRRRLLARLNATNVDGIAVSPVGGPVLYVDHSSPESNLMLIESFR